MVCTKGVVQRSNVEPWGVIYFARQNYCLGPPIRIPSSHKPLSLGVFSEIPLKNVSPSHLILRIHRIHPIASENIQSDSIDQKIVVLTL
jgi:hypothetical protein